MNRPSAFTLIELLVVISIIAVLAGMLLPAVGMVRDQARTSLCGSNLRQIGMGVVMYGSDWDGLIPPGFIQNSQVATHPELNHPAGKHLAWSDEDRIGQYLDGAETIGGDYTAWRYAAPFLCPADRRVSGGVTYYSSSYGLSHRLFKTCVGNALDYGPAWRQSMSQWKRAGALAIGTDTQESRWFSQSSDQATAPPVFYYSNQAVPTAWSSSDYQQPNHMFARHRGGANVIFGDGHLEFSKTLPADVQAKRVFVRMEDM